jgi:hypothetical protein
LTRDGDGSKESAVCFVACKFESVTQVRREYRRVFNEEPPHENSIRRWDRQLKEAGSLLDKQRSGRSSVSDETVENIRNNFIRSPKKSVRKCARELGLSKTTVHRVLKKSLCFTGYKLQLLYTIRPGGNLKRYDFAVDIVNEINEKEQFLHRVMFRDEATFHVTGHVHRQNVRKWANERPHDFVAHERDSPIVNVWCALTRGHVIGPCFFAEGTVTSHNYFDMLELFAVPQIDDDSVIFRQDGASAHYANIVTEFLDEIFPRRWIWRDGWKQWPQRSPNLTPLNFYFWGYMKKIVCRVYIYNTQHLKQRIREAAVLSLLMFLVECCRKWNTA